MLWRHVATGARNGHCVERISRCLFLVSTGRAGAQVCAEVGSVGLERVSHVSGRASLLALQPQPTTSGIQLAGKLFSFAAMLVAANLETPFQRTDKLCIVMRGGKRCGS